MEESIQKQLEELRLENLQLRQQLEISNKIIDISELRKPEKAEPENYNLIQKLTDNIPAFIALVDRNFRYLFVNKFYSGTKFFNPDNIVGKSIRNLIGEERFEKQLPLYQKVLKGESVEYEIEHQSENHKHYFFKINLVPYFKNNGTEGFFVYAFDITAIRTAEKAVKKSEQKSRSIFEQSHISTAIVGLDKKIMQVNEAFCLLLGYDESEIVGKTIADITYPDDIRIGMEEMKKIATGELKKALVQKRYLHKNGNVIWGDLTINLVRNEDKTPLYYIAVIQDVTNRLMAEKTLKETEKNLRLITDNIPALVGQIDNKLRYIYVNKRYELYSGIEANQIIGKNVNEVITEDTFKISQPFMQRALSGESVSFETKYRNLAGEDIYFQSNFIPNYEDNKVVNFFVLAWDISEVKKNEGIIQKQNEQLKESNSTKDKFFSIIAHDLRSPFNNILGFSELLIEKENDIELTESLKYLNIINSSANNTLILLDNLLNWAKSQTGKINFNPVNLVLSDVILEAIKYQKSIATAKKISLNYFSSDEILIFADENMVNTILRNLISNAIKFTKAGGQIRVFAIKKHKHVEITISDNGIGMNDEKLKKLFKLSSNSSTLGTADEKGSGLGLVLCKEFVEKHEGEIWVESQEGKGSEFKFSLPLNISE